MIHFVMVIIYYKSIICNHHSSSLWLKIFYLSYIAFKMMVSHAMDQDIYYLLKKIKTKKHKIMILKHFNGHYSAVNWCTLIILFLFYVCKRQQLKN